MPLAAERLDTDLRRSAVLILLVICVVAVVLLLLQTGGGERAASRSHEGHGEAPGAGGAANPVEGDAASAATAAEAATAAIDDDPNRVPGADLVIAGRVVRDGVGVEGAAVAALRAPDSSPGRWMPQAFDAPPPPIATTSSGQGGRFDLRIARRSRLALQAAKKGCGTASLFLLMPPSGDPPEVTLRLRPGGAIEGIVVDEKGGPVRDADVALASQGWVRFSAEIAARTDALGRFSVEDVPEGNLRVRVRAAGYPEARQWVNFPSQKFVRIELRSAGIIEGTVTDGGGAPVAGARVMISTSAWERSGASGAAKAETDAGGAYRMEVYPGSVQTAVVEHPRFGRQSAGEGTFPLPTALIEAGKTLAYDIRLRKGVEVRGVAVYAETQAPAAGATITLLRMSSQWRGLDDWSSARADDDGRFEFPYVIEGTYGLEAKGEHGARIATRYPQGNERPTIDFFTDGEMPVPAQRLDLGATGTIRGRVLGLGDLDTNQRPNIFLRVAASYANATVDDVGAFELTHVPPMEDAVLESNNPPAKSDPFRVEAGKTVEVNLDASKQGISGVVEDEAGRPVARAVVHLVPQSQIRQQLPQIVQQRGWGGALTDEKGRFRVGAAGGGGDYWATQKYVAVALKQGYSSAISEAFDLPAEGSEGPELRLVLPRGGVVRGRVEFLGGSPAPGIAVTLSPKQAPAGPPPTGGPQTSYTDSDGRFEAAGIGEGVHMAYAHHPQGKVEPREVRAGDDGVKLVIEPALAIAGVVVTEDKRPVPQAQVSVLVPKERGEQPQTAQTQPNGRFRVGQLAAGSYALEVSPNVQYWGAATSFEKQRVEGVAAGTENLVIVVSEGKGLRGKVEDPRGQPVPGAGVIAMPLRSEPQKPGSNPWEQSQPSATTNGRGEFEIKGLGTAEVEVLVIADGYLPAMQRAVAGGAPVLLRLAPGEVIEGRLQRSNGKPAARRWIWLQPLTKETQDKLNDWQRRGGQAWNYLGGWNMQGATTDGDGLFRLSSLLPGEYRVQTQEWGSDEILPPTTLRTGMPPVTLRLEQALSIRGRVTDPEGRPIVLEGGQRVYINAQRDNQHFSSAVAGDDGRFEVKSLPTGTVTLQVWAGNEYKAATVQVVAGSADVTVTLERRTQPPAKSR